MFANIFVAAAVIAAVFVVGVVFWCNWDSIFDKKEYEYKKKLTQKYSCFSTAKEFKLAEQALLQRKESLAQRKKDIERIGDKNIRNATKDEIKDNLFQKMIVLALHSERIKDDILSKKSIMVDEKYIYLDIAYVNRQVKELQKHSA